MERLSVAYKIKKNKTLPVLPCSQYKT